MARGTCVVAFGGIATGKSFWVRTHLEELRSQWFGTERIDCWDGLNGTDLAPFLASAVGTSTTVVVDHPHTDEHWETLFTEIPRLKDAGLHFFVVTQPNLSLMGKLMPMAESWVFFRMKDAPELFADPAIRDICPLRESAANELRYLSTGEFRVVANPRAHRLRDS